jgi:hypothetical protein
MKAVNTEGLRFFRSSLISHILVSSHDRSKIHDVLVLVCQAFGAFGIKIGQFLLATGVLPEKESQSLRSLEDRAREPSRDEIYSDIKNFDFRLKNSLGGASLKYVSRIVDSSEKEWALKVLAKDANFHVRLEILLFKRIANELVKSYGARYQIFKTAIDATSEAILREINLADEVRRGETAQKYMYKACDDRFGFTTHVGGNHWVSERIVKADLMAGQSIHTLDPKSRARAAAFIISCELEHLFPTTKDLKLTDRLYFDPDRHPGNYLITEGRLHPIDFGQLHTFTVAERDRVVEMFALAGILNRLKASWWGIFYVNSLSKKLLSLFLDNPTRLQVSQLVSALQTQPFYEQEQTIATYYHILATLNKLGYLETLAMDKKLVLYDIPRGIAQFARYHNMMQEDPDLQNKPASFESVLSDRATKKAMEFSIEFSFSPLADTISLSLFSLLATIKMRHILFNPRGRRV